MQQLELGRKRKTNLIIRTKSQQSMYKNIDEIYTYVIVLGC